MIVEFQKQNEKKNLISLEFEYICFQTISSVDRSEIIFRLTTRLFSCGTSGYTDDAFVDDVRCYAHYIYRQNYFPPRLVFPLFSNFYQETSLRRNNKLNLKIKNLKLLYNNFAFTLFFFIAMFYYYCDIFNNPRIKTNDFFF